MILTYEIPTSTSSYVDYQWGEINVTSGNAKNFDFPATSYLKIEEPNNNFLIFITKTSSEVENGVIEVFKQNLRNSPLHSQKIKDFAIAINLSGLKSEFYTYEHGLIIASNLIRESLDKCQTTIHIPYYRLEIRIPELYLGDTLQQLQKIRADIHDLQTESSEILIVAFLPVSDALKIADILRQATEGNAFWSFTSTEFRPQT